MMLVNNGIGMDYFLMFMEYFDVGYLFVCMMVVIFIWDVVLDIEWVRWIYYYVCDVLYDVFVFFCYFV